MDLTPEQLERRSDAQKKYYHNLENRLKDLARGAVSDAIRRGRLSKRPCEKCGSQCAQAHHHDYTKPLDVQWLCGKCHGAEHRQKHCARGHELTADNLYVRPNGKRRCRECRRIDMRRYRERLVRGMGVSDRTGA